MGDRLLGLWHDAVVGCDHEHSDVGHLRASGAHRGERFVTGSVEESDLSIVDSNLIGADMLSDAAVLRFRNAAFSNRVQQ